MKFPAPRSERRRGSRRGGTVYLVGAGPGDPGLLTVKAARLLRRADIVVHDALVGEGILARVASSATLIDVGKRCGGRHTTQERINEILITSARNAKTVVRLKGGDPFVFGRGGEEALALAAAGVRFEVVPGVTAAVGVSAYAGIPLTHRDFASSVTFVTGHEDTGRRDARVDWDALGRLGGTLVIYMGMTGLESIARRLVAAGRSPDTPAAAVEWGTHARQRTVDAPLASIAASAREAGIGAPALVVVGEVAALRDRVAWFDRLPLRGRRLVVARARPQRSRLAAALRRLGAEVAEYPHLRAEAVVESPEIDAAFASLADYRWLAFTSPAGVRSFWRKLERRGLDARALAGLKVASLGLATTRALLRRGVTADLTTRTYDPTTVANLLEADGSLGGSSVLLVRDSAPDSRVASALREAGAVVQDLTLFRIVPDDFGTWAWGEPDAILLPSSNAARLVEGRIPLGERTRIVAIGPRTAETALALGLTVDAVADDQTIPGTVRALIDLLSSDQPPARSGPVSADRPSIGV